MRIFKKDNRIEKTKDKIIAEALLQSGYTEIDSMPKAEEDVSDDLKTSKRRSKTDEKGLE